MSDTNLKEAIRYLLLPIPESKEAELIETTKAVLNGFGIEEEAYGLYLRNKFEEWKAGGDLDAQFAILVGTLLQSSDEEIGDLLADKYYPARDALVKNPLVSHEIAIIALSHLRLIIHLAVKERMSSAKLRDLLVACDARLSVLTWSDVQSVLASLRVEPKLKLGQVEELFAEDQELEEDIFADSDLEEACFLVGQVARSLEYEGDLAEYLRILSAPYKEEIAFIPYLQIIHYQCTICEFYDHVPSIAYEFSPRGQVAGWVFSKWNELTNTGNPILNNAKGVDQLTTGWAVSKKQGEFHRAMTLAKLLKGLDSMAFLACKELASWLRRWLLRFIRLNHQEENLITTELSIEQVNVVATRIADEQTHTYGVLEQRFVDYVVACQFHNQAEWRPRGFGDAVHANNFSRRKLGDCDLQSPNALQILAFEAHGGLLTQTYLDGHLHTLARLVERRSEELEGIAELDQWSILITFIAHNYAIEKAPITYAVGDLTIGISFLDYEEFLSSIDEVEDATKLICFEEQFVERLNDRRTARRVRDIVLDLI